MRKQFDIELVDITRRRYKMLRKLFITTDTFAPTIVRLALGIVILPHGAQKLLGLFGGYGFSGTMSFMTETMGIPAVFAFLAIVAEFFGGLGLITGTLTRLSALGTGVTLAVAALMVHTQNGFFMNWFGNQAGEGYEYHILFVAMALSLVLTGGGRFSIDRFIAEKIVK